MKKRHPFSYIVLRYVHDTRSGEFLNVGVAVFAPKQGQIEFKFQKKISRLRSVFPDLQREPFQIQIKNLESGLRKLARQTTSQSELFDDHNDISKVVHKILPKDDSAFQWSSLGEGVTDNLSEKLNVLFHRFVTQYDVPAQRRRTDDDVWKPVRAALKSRNIPVQFETRNFEGRDDSVEFENAWKNGKWNVYEAVSLDYSNPESIKDRMRKWRGHLASVAEGLNEDFVPHFIVGKPENTSLLDSYHEALKILKGSPLSPNVFEESDLPSFMDELEDKYRKHLAEGREIAEEQHIIQKH